MPDGVPLRPEAADLAEPGGMVVLGKIVGAHGIQGAVRVYPYADDPLVWSRLPHWWLGREEGGEQQGWMRNKLLSCSPSNAFLIARLAGIADRTSAEGSNGMLVGVPRELMPATAENEYYWGDLLGLAVVNTRDEPLGQVLGLIETPANAVLRVGDGEHAERLLPFVGAVVIEVDRVAGRLRVEWETDW